MVQAKFWAAPLPLRWLSSRLTLFWFASPSSSQGEMVQAKFGVPSVAVRQLEVFSNAVLTATLQVGTEPIFGPAARMWL